MIMFGKTTLNSQREYCKREYLVTSNILQIDKPLSNRKARLPGHRWREAIHQRAVKWLRDVKSRWPPWANKMVGTAGFCAKSCDKLHEIACKSQNRIAVLCSKIWCDTIYRKTFWVGRLFDIASIWLDKHWCSSFVALPILLQRSLVLQATSLGEESGSSEHSRISCLWPVGGARMLKHQTLQ